MYQGIGYKTAFFIINEKSTHKTAITPYMQEAMAV